MMDALGRSFEEALKEVVPEAERGAVRERYEQEATQVILRVRGVSADGGPKPWFNDWDPSNGYYWVRQRQYLLDSGRRNERALEALDDDSDRVLSHMEDPRASGPQSFNSRGLVLGFVQSGKTENFSALIAKAADLGYKVVIVLSGMHNALRQQTQRRLDRELGLVPGVGVGLPEPGRRWISMTTADLHGDFDPGTSDANVLQGNEQVIFVVKKFGRVLDRLIKFIHDAKPPANLPVLIVDDEADQASVNTGGNRPPSAPPPGSDDDDMDLDDLYDEDDADLNLEDETDPSKINAKIRTIIASFQRVAYVAYTATPFANVLIPHDAEDREVYEDLYPKDFILTLPPKPGYVGTERLFGRDTLDGTPEGEVEGLDVIRFIPSVDVGDVIPVGVKVDDFAPSVPPSLDLAVIDWLLSTGGLLARAEDDDHPSSMLIHTHQRTRVQNELAPQIVALVSRLRQEWRYGDGHLRREMWERWDSEFRPVTVRIDPARDRPFEDIEPHIDRLMKEPIPVLALNSASEDVLDYEAEPNLKAIMIGGNRLSRGMTLEGLTISYYVRRTPYYDTLLQMARWFGYREWYVDLTRLWTTPLLASWFRDLSLREEELRRQIGEAEKAKLKPDQVGYLIRSHPAMMVTAQNKMGAGRVEKLSYAGRMIQTTRFRLDDADWLKSNLDAVRGFVGGLGVPGIDPSGALFWDGVPADAVVELLANYQTVQDRTSFDADAARRYILAQLGNDELQHWQVAIRTQQQESDLLKTIDLGVDGYGEVNAIARTRLKNDPTSIGVLTNPAKKSGPIRQGDEEIGLSDKQIQTARQELAEDEFDSIREALIAQRPTTRGLLVIYPISRYSKKRANSTDRVDLFENPDTEGETIVGLALAFPPSESAATVEYVAGSVAQAAE